MGVIEIRDPNLNQNELLDRLAEQLDGKPIPDFSDIGPGNLRQLQAAILPNAETESLTQDTLIDLMMMHELVETPFTSETPVIGPWIIRLRELWNWMSTKWYVRPIMRQQSAINGQMVLLLMGMDAMLKDQQDAIIRLKEKVACLEAVIASNELHGK